MDIWGGQGQPGNGFPGKKERMHGQGEERGGGLLAFFKNPVR